jgi:hypothetical protein
MYIREEIDGHQALEVIVQECSPGLGWRFPLPHNVPADAGLTDVAAEF